MGDLPESKVSIPELSELARRWPPAVITHYAVATAIVARVETGGQGTIPEETAGGVRVLWHHDQVRYVPACGTLPLGSWLQLWRCQVSWCTVWKGAPQDLMDHVRGSHKVPEEVQHIKLETLIPPWKVTRQVYMDSLT